MKEIKLTRELVTQVDDDDFEYLNQFKWHCWWHRKTYYVGRWKTENGKQKHILMHRDILNTISYSLKTDHRDGNGLNNQKANLRLCSNSQNLMNQRKIGRLKGAYEHKGKYESSIRINYKSIYLGRYSTKEEAARAYDEKAKELFGEFAHTNF